MPRWERLERAKRNLGRAMNRDEKHCYLKVCHGEDAAQTEAERLRRKGHNVRAYRCDNCGEWHVGRVSQL